MYFSFYAFKIDDTLIADDILGDPTIVAKRNGSLVEIVADFDYNNLNVLFPESDINLILGVCNVKTNECHDFSSVAVNSGKYTRSLYHANGTDYKQDACRRQSSAANLPILRLPNCIIIASADAILASIQLPSSNTIPLVRFRVRIAVRKKAGLSLRFVVLVQGLIDQQSPEAELDRTRHRRARQLRVEGRNGNSGATSQALDTCTAQ